MRELLFQGGACNQTAQRRGPDELSSVQPPAAQSDFTVQLGLVGPSISRLLHLHL